MDTHDSNEIHKLPQSPPLVTIDSLLTPSLVLQEAPDPQFRLEVPILLIKTVNDSGDLLALQSFNFACDHRIFPDERQQLDVAGCYPLLAYTGCRPADVVDGEKNLPLDGCWTSSSATKPCCD